MHNFSTFQNWELILFVLNVNTLLDYRTLLENMPNGRKWLTDTVSKLFDVRISVEHVNGSFKFIVVKHGSKEDGVATEWNRINNNRKPNAERRKRENTAIEDRLRSERRAKVVIIQKTRNIGANRMLTLTFQENITDVEVAFKAFSEFCRLMVKKYGSFDYVCVPERQKRGAIHFHLALNKYYNWTAILAVWRVAIKKTGTILTGGIFINRLMTDKSANRIARYIAKYIGKGEKIVEKNKKSYYTSKSAHVEKEKITTYSFLAPDTYVFRDVLDFFIKTVKGFASYVIDFKAEFTAWDGCKGWVFYCTGVRDSIYDTPQQTAATV